MRLSNNALTHAEFLVEEAEGYGRPLGCRAIVHCHQHAVMGFAAEQRLYENIGLDLEVLDSGFCDPAGSGRFEMYKHELSIGTGTGCSCPSPAKPAPLNYPHDGWHLLQDRPTDLLYRSVGSPPPC